MAEFWQQLTEKAKEGGWEKNRDDSIADLVKMQQNLKLASREVANNATEESKELARRLEVEAALIGQAKSWAELQYPAIISSLHEMFNAAETNDRKAYIEEANRNRVLIDALKKQLSDAQGNFTVLSPGWQDLVATIHVGINNLMFPAMLKSKFSPGLMALYFLGVGSGFDTDVMILNLKMRGS